MKKRLISLLMVLTLMVSLVGCAQESTSNEGKSVKQDVTVAWDIEPPMLDPTLTTSTAARDINKYIYEGVVEMDANFEPQPQLAEKIEHNDDNTEWTFYLRKGVKFHDGTEMKAEDVAASLNRWSGINGSAKLIIKNGEKFEVKDDYTVTIKLDTPCLLFLYYLANPSQFAGITKKSIVEAADSSSGYKSIIGTGAMKFVEWKQNEYIKLEKFADYSVPSAKLSGFAGDKTVNFNTLTFYMVNDASTRVAGALADQYDFVNKISYDSMNQFDGVTNCSLTQGQYMIGGLIFEKKEGCGSYSEDPNFRKAVSYALDINEIAKAQVPNSDYVTIDSDYMGPFQTAWDTNAGDAYYNKHDLAKAKEYLAQSKYDGGTVKMVTNTEYPDMYNGTLVVQKQLEAIGIKVEVEVMDWATQLTRINQPETLDMFVSNFGVSPIPNTLLFLTPGRTGFTHNAAISSIFDQMGEAKDMTTAQSLWKEAQKAAWEEAEFIPLGHQYTVVSKSSRVENYTGFMGLTLWGCTVYEP